MAIERERKFLVNQELLPASFLRECNHSVRVGKHIRTGYFTERGVAIRVSQNNVGMPDEKCKVCFKSPGAEERQEFEYVIPNKDAQELIELAPTLLTKIRYDWEGWEIDRIHLSGEPDLWMAEWEEHEGKAPFPDALPRWIGREVTHEPRIYSNQALAWVYGRVIHGHIRKETG